MKLSLSLLLLLSLFIYLNVPASAQGKDTLFTANDLNNLTVMLYQPISNVIGTATIIKHNQKFYLLTANHVANSMHSGAKIVFRVGNDLPAIMDLNQLTKKQDPIWINHSSADLSMLEITPFNSDVATRLQSSSFPSYLINPAKQAPPDSFEYIYLGYPVLDLNLQHFSSLFFNTHISSGLITQKRLDNGTSTNFYYLGNPGMEGCSGSGVYISVKNGGMFMSAGKTILVGVVHGTQGDTTGGKLCMITPSYYIWDLLKDL